MDGMRGTGARTSVSTAELITASVMAASASSADGWAGDHFMYNTAVVNVEHYCRPGTSYVDRTVINNTTVLNHASFQWSGRH